MGFKEQLDSILNYLPYRQTLLFSATQTKSIKDLARLSLNSPEYLSLHVEADEVTPKQLIQNYVICKLPDKLDMLYSFIKTHLKSKIIVFFSSCSQVRFVYECFRSMQPGVVLTALHGKIKQEKRTLIYMDFVRRKAACMLATDIASRGLDFPDVDWVIQLDAPEDSAMYIHRAGRTARYKSGGRSLLVLLPSEENRVITDLSKANIPIKKLTINNKYTVSVSSTAAALLVAQPELRSLAKKAFTSYLRSIQLIPNNDNFDMKVLPVNDFANSLGLAFTPEVPVVAKRKEEGREELRGKKNINRSLDKLKRQIKEAKELKKKNKSSDLKTEALPYNDDDDDDDENDEEFFEIKKSEDNSYDQSVNEQTNELLTTGKKNKLKIRSDGTLRGLKIKPNAKITFNDEGSIVENPLEKLTLELNENNNKKYSLKNKLIEIDENVRKVKARIDEGRKEDYQREKERIKKKHLDQKLLTKSYNSNSKSNSGPELSFPVVEDNSDDLPYEVYEDESESESESAQSSNEYYDSS